MTRPTSVRDGACICDYNPSTTDGPEETCPFHGRPYAYWVERGDIALKHLDALAYEIEAVVHHWETTPALRRGTAAAEIRRALHRAHAATADTDERGRA